MTFLGLEFLTFITKTGKGTPGIVLGNQHVNLNIRLSQGPIFTSDHLPIYIRHCTAPVVIRGKKTFKINNVNCELFQNYLNR